MRLNCSTTLVSSWTARNTLSLKGATSALGLLGLVTNGVAIMISCYLVIDSLAADTNSAPQPLCVLTIKARSVNYISKLY